MPLPRLRRSSDGEALVLSGGGSRADFQIGALRYLYDVVGIEPHVFVGTSAGSIVSVTLAQYSDPADQAAAVARLDELWAGMTQQSDMFDERAWYTRLRTRAPEWTAMVKPPARGRRDGTRGRLSLPFGRFSNVPAPSLEPVSLDSSPESPPFAPHYPTAQEETLAMARADDTPAPIEWTPALVMQALSAVSKIRKSGGDLARIIRGADRTRSIYRPGPILDTLLSRDFFDAERVAGSGNVLRIAMVGLESGELRFMREDGRLVDRDNVALDAGPFDISLGVLASCSIPTVFPPVAIDGEHYVDGGIRENLAAEMAMSHLGATRPYVLAAVKQGVPREDSYAHRDMLAIILRAVAILTDEAGRDEVAYARSLGAIVLEPEIDVHSPLTVDPGLIAINRDYGWLRAAEEHLLATPAERALNHRVINLRLHSWHLENELLETTELLEPVLAQLVKTKTELARLLTRVRPGMLPGDAESWPDHWERHPGGVAASPPWVT